MWEFPAQGSPAADLLVQEPPAAELLVQEPPRAESLEQSHLQQNHWHVPTLLVEYCRPPCVNRKPALTMQQQEKLPLALRRLMPHNKKGLKEE